jgi:hypothetical protein
VTTIPNAKAEAAEETVEHYNSGRIKFFDLPTHLYGANPSQMPEQVEDAFLHAAKAHRVWMVSETPEGGRGLPDTDPIKHAHDCRVLLDEALARLVAAVDAHTAARNAQRSAA